MLVCFYQCHKILGLKKKVLEIAAKMLEGGGEAHLGRTVCILILAKKQYSNAMLKLKQDGEYVNCCSDLNSLPQGAQGGREGTVLVAPGKCHLARRELSTQFLSVNPIGGERKAFIVCLCISTVTHSP